MENEEIKTEEYLNSNMRDIKPPRLLFDNTMKVVTNRLADRNTLTKKDEVKTPSHYQLTSFFMKKIALLGIPLVALVLVLVVTYNRSNNSLVGQAPKDSSNSGTQVSGNNSDTSIDSIVKDILNEVDIELADIENESSDITAIDSELDAFNNLSINSYENI